MNTRPNIIHVILHLNQFVDALIIVCQAWHLLSFRQIEF